MRPFILGLAGLTVHSLANPVVGPDLHKRDCEALPQGAGPVPTPDTPEAFAASGEYASIAQAAVVPAGYTLAYGPKQASSDGKVSVGTDVLESYEPSVCAAACEGNVGCAGFDIFFERAPTLSPGASCPKPPSTTLIKCNYWGYPISDATATQTGELLGDFQVLVAGAKGYNRDAATQLSDYTTTPLGDAAIRSPNDCNGKDSYITVKTFPGDSPFNAQRCRQACIDETQWNKDHLNGRATCRFFNLYLLLKNGEPYQQVCSMYQQGWDASVADNRGQTRDGDQYTIAYSYGFVSTTDAFVEPICPSDISQLSSPENIEFCAAYIGLVEPAVETSRVAATVSTVLQTTVTQTSTVTPATVTVLSTVVSSSVTTVVVATQYTTTTVVVAGGPSKRAAATPALVSTWLPEKISAACSSVATASSTSTTTQTTATETLYTATEPSVTTEVSTAPTPLTTILTTSPLFATSQITTTLITTTTSVGISPSNQCSSRPIRLCCMNVAPWSSNSGVWGGICGYTPPNNDELIGARCIAMPASGSCPSGTLGACCTGTVPGPSGQCALGTQCARL